MLMILLSAIGIVGAVGFGVLGITSDAGQYERILALAFLAMGAAGIVGYVVQDGEKPHSEGSYGVTGIVMAVVSVPVMVISAGVFVATLIPCFYLMLPFLLYEFGLWVQAETPHGGGTTHRAPRRAVALST